jgi:hypothetical protein
MPNTPNEKDSETVKDDGALAPDDLDNVSGGLEFSSGGGGGSGKITTGWLEVESFDEGVGRKP